MILALIFVAYFAFMVPVTHAASVSEGYITQDENLSIGMAASLSSDSGAQERIVERGVKSNKDRFIGIVTNLDDNLLTLTDTNSTVVITTLGEVSAFVTDLDGEVKKGDFLTTSPIRGYLMLASSSETSVIGTALEDFPKDTAEAVEVSNNSGSKRTALANTMKIDLSPKSISSSAKNNTFLLIFGRSLTGKSVSQVQVMVALVIFFFLLIVEGSIIYGAIYSSITALGRNPLARTALYKQLFQVSLIALVILGIGLVVIYAVLWA